jgi:glycerol kinase
MARLANRRVAIRPQKRWLRGVDAKVTFGTDAFALAISGDDPTPSPGGALPTIAWQIDGKRTYAVDAGVYNAGSAVDWLLRMGMTEVRQASFAYPPAIDRDVVFVPALSGLACPYWDRTAAGLWLGLSPDTSREDMAQAVLEGVALATVEALGVIGADNVDSAPLCIDGGLAENGYFVDVLAAALGRPVLVRDFREVTAFGALSLASLGAGLPCETTKLEHSLHPPRWTSATWRSRYHEAVGRSRTWRRM